MTSTATPALPQTTTTTWNIDPAHTVAEFKVKHMMIANVKGHFSGVSGVLTNRRKVLLTPSFIRLKRSRPRLSRNNLWLVATCMHYARQPKFREIEQKGLSCE